jgi:hypothetical protein
LIACCAAGYRLFLLQDCGCQGGWYRESFLSQPPGMKRFKGELTNEFRITPMLSKWYYIDCEMRSTGMRTVNYSSGCMVKV